MPQSLRELLQPHGLCNDIIRIIATYVESVIVPDFKYPMSDSVVINYTSDYKNKEGIEFDCKCNNGEKFIFDHACSYYYNYWTETCEYETNIKIEYSICWHNFPNGSYGFCRLADDNYIFMLSYGGDTYPTVVLVDNTLDSLIKNLDQIFDIFPEQKTLIGSEDSCSFEVPDFVY